MNPQDDHLEKLKEETQRIRQRKAAPRATPNSSVGNLAMRSGMELVAGVLLGAGAGILLDRWLGTLPLFLIIGFFLGAAGGSLNLYRLAQSSAKDGATTQQESTKDSD